MADPTTSRRRRVLRVVLPLLLLIAVLYTGAALLQARRVIDSLRALAAEPTVLLDDSAALDRARDELTQLRRLLGPLPQLASFAAPLPLVGPSLAAVEPGLTALDEGMAALQLMLPAVTPLLGEGMAPADLLREPQRWIAPGPAESDLRAAAEHAAATERALARLPARETLPTPLRAQLAEAEPLLRLLLPLSESLYVAALLAPYAPDLLPLLADDDASAEPDITQLLSVLQANSASLPALQASTVRMRTAWDRLPADGLPATIAEQVPLARAAAALTVVLSDGLLVAADFAPLLTAADDGGGPPTAQLVALVVTLEDELQRLQTDLIAAHAAWAAFDGEYRTVTALLERAARAVTALQVVPQLLGSEQPQPTLLLALSNDELRPGGGFLTAVGRITLQQGRYTAPQMEDSRLIVPPAYRSSPPTPPELGESMRIYRWFFRDANWSPDFRESVRVARLLYEQSGRGTVSQALALDLIALRELVDLVGPLRLPGVAQPVTGDAVHETLRRAHDVNSDDNSSAVSELLAALLSELGRRREQLPQLALLLADLADRRHLVLVSDEPQAAAALHSLGWDGAVTPGRHDYLALVEANLGYTKTSAALQTAVEYRVDLRAPFSPQATLTLTQRLDLAPQSACPPLDDPSYTELMQACHRGLVQLLVPRSAVLLSADLPSPAVGWLWNRPLPAGAAVRVSQQAETTDFEHYYTLLPGGQRTAVLQYTLPSTVLTALPGGGWRYTLRLQKQISQAPLPVRIDVLLPRGFALRDTTPLPSTLRLDGTIEVSVEIVPTGREAQSAPAGRLR